jgi:hypothetical protein
MWPSNMTAMLLVNNDTQAGQNYKDDAKWMKAGESL